MKKYQTIFHIVSCMHIFYKYIIKNAYKNVSKQELISKAKQRYNVNGRENVKKLFEILRKS